MNECKIVATIEAYEFRKPRSRLQMGAGTLTRVVFETRGEKQKMK